VIRTRFGDHQPIMAASIVAMKSSGGGKRTYHRGMEEVKNKNEIRLAHCVGWESDAGLCLSCAQVKVYRSTTGSMEGRQTTMALWLAFILMCFYICQSYLYNIDATVTVTAALTKATRMHPCCFLS
jgi:hypothetical protein